MARSADALPDPIERRVLLHGEGKAADLVALGERYLAAGRLSDAAAFFERAKDHGRLADLKRRVLAGDSKDFWMLVRLERNPATAPSADEWKQAADAALSAGRYHQAATFYDKAKDEDGARRAREQVQAMKAELPPPRPRVRSASDLGPLGGAPPVAVGSSSDI